MHTRLSQFSSALVVVVVVGVFPTSAEAQRAAGPFAGILGAASDADAQSLVVRGSLFGAWDDTITRADSAAPVDERFLRSGVASGASGSLAHALQTSRLQWQSSAASSLRLYGTQSDAIAATFQGQTAVNGTVSRRVSLSGSASFMYSPYYDFAPDLDGRLSNVGAFGGGFGVATEAARNTTAIGGGGMSVRLSRRDTFSTNGSIRRYDFLDQPDSGIDTWSVAGRFSHTFTRSLGLHAGLGREEAAYQSPGSHPAVSNTIDVGVDYNDTLTFSRRTTFSFGTSTSAIRWNDDTHYSLNGSATLGRGFGRSGSASLQYQRATDFDPAFREPVQTDSVSAGVNNQIGRRASWTAQAGYMRGGIGFESTGGRFDSYHAGGGVNMAVTRHIGIFTDYSIYRYEVPAGSTVFTSLSRFSRQSVSVGLTLWAPLISEKRSSSDSR